MRRLFPIIAVILVSTASLAQNTPSDSQTLRALLDEVRQLRKDLQTTTVAAQRVQVALYRLQLEDASVVRARTSLEEARTGLARKIDERQHFTDEVERLEEARTHLQDEHEKKAIEELLPGSKRRLEQLATEEQQWQSKVSEAETALRVEQNKVDALHATLDELDQALQNVGRRIDSAGVK